MYIHSHSRFVGPPADDVQRYKEDVSRYTQLHFRRANGSCCWPWPALAAVFSDGLSGRIPLFT